MLAPDETPYTGLTPFVLAPDGLSSGVVAPTLVRLDAYGLPPRYDAGTALPRRPAFGVRMRVHGLGKGFTDGASTFRRSRDRYAVRSRLLDGAPT